MRRSVKSKLPSSLPDPAFASRRTGASAVPTSVCALATSLSLVPNSFVNRERATLIGLTCLTNNGRVPVAPKLNRRRAVFVLSKIDETLAWERAADQERDSRFVDLGRYLCEVRAGQYWRLDKLGSFDEFLERKFPESRRKAYYLMAIHEHLTPIRKRELELIGWTKARELAKVARRDREGFDRAPWVHKASTMPREEFKREVDRYLTGKETEPWEILGAAFLAGVSLETGNRDALLPCLTRLVIGLPKPQRKQLLEEVQVTL